MSASEINFERHVSYQLFLCKLQYCAPSNYVVWLGIANNVQESDKSSFPSFSLEARSSSKILLSLSKCTLSHAFTF